MIEQWSRPSQSIYLGVYEEAKIPEEAINVGDDGIEDEHIFQRIRVDLPKRLVILDNCLHSTARHDIAHGNERHVLTGKKLTLGADLRFPFGDSVQDSGDAEIFGYLPSVEFRVRLVAGIRRSFRSPFI